MARLLRNKQSVELRNGARLISAAELLGVPFGCHVGMCGACMVKVLEGQENLSVHTWQEKSMELKPGFRLACQAKIRSGAVKIRF